MPTIFRQIKSFGGLLPLFLYIDFSITIPTYSYNHSLITFAEAHLHGDSAKFISMDSTVLTKPLYWFRHFDGQYLQYHCIDFFISMDSTCNTTVLISSVRWTVLAIPLYWFLHSMDSTYNTTYWFLHFDGQSFQYHCIDVCFDDKFWR